MPSFVTPANGDDALAEHVAQLTENLSGLRNIPIQLTGINDATNYAQTIKNVGAGSKDCIMYAADGTTVLFQVDASGVRASASGGAAAPILTTASSIAGLIEDESVTNAKLASDTARAQLLTNGGFEIWQRGDAFTTHGAYTADRWKLSTSGATVTRDVAGTTTALKIVNIAGGTILFQDIEDVKQLRGRTVSVAIRLNANAASSVRIDLQVGVEHHYSSYHPGDAAYQTLTTSAVLATDVTSLEVAILFDTVVTAYIESAMLVVGTVAADYAPLHPADDLARCQRYYEVIGSDQNSFSITSYQQTGQPVWLPVLYKAKKPVNPTLTKNGTWPILNCAQPSFLSGGTGSCVFGTSSTASIGTISTNNDAPGCNLTVEANP